jgi:hypothetical protein
LPLPHRRLSGLRAPGSHSLSCARRVRGRCPQKAAIPATYARTENAAAIFSFRATTALSALWGMTFSPSE